MMLTSGAIRSLVVLLQGLLLMLLLPFRWGYVLQGRRSVERSSKDGKVVVRVPAAMVPQRIVRGEQDEALARRAMAIERVRETDGGDVRRGYSVFVTSRGEGLFTQSWAPVSGDIK
ncbi:hypothetical protein QJS04_geneDACA017416 [Acorus gramineus]|uniref:Uncharacterized protein n=1 Tax=Acorus gramineus TaxID=55184 RepID=A0AAV9AI88_ACOGR|nr:hypothetical protein QJS04_geneDACA017416 [Acorus gramineus]